MKVLSKTAYQRAKNFLLTQARPLEASLFRYHFEDGAAAAVIEALGVYQNADGGFGNALEPDVRMPDSSVVATQFALQALVDIGAGSQEKLVQDAVAYLLRVFDARKQVWRLVDERAMDAPHAPWWDYAGLEKAFGGFLANPRAGILRLLLHYQELVPDGFNDRVLAAVMVHFDRLPVEMPFFDAASYLKLLQSDRLDEVDRERLLDKLKHTAVQITSRDPETWHTFAVKPLWLAPDPEAPLAQVLSDDIQKNLDYEIEVQNEDGSWSPNWSWGGNYPENWLVAEKEWRGVLTLANLRSLRAFRRIEALPPDVGQSTFKYHLD
jgi:hypothetical protein